jgi:hypothetical protein
MYRNAITPSKLFALVLLVLSMTGVILWVGFLVDEETPAFDRVRLALLAATLGSFILSILFLRRAKWARRAASILLHMLMLAMVGFFLLAISMAETLTEAAQVASVTILIGGLLFVAILGLHSEGMRRDLAGDAPSPPRARPHRRKFLLGAAGCVLLLLAVAAWRIVPLLLAKPTIAVDYLAQLDKAMRPADYDPNLDAAPHYDRLFSQFVPLPEELQDQYRLWPTDLSDEEREALEKWAPRNEPALMTLAQALERPYWCHSLQRDPNGSTIPHAQKGRELAWAVILLAKFKASQGDIDAAFRLLIDLHAMGMHRVRSATIADQMTGLAVCSITYDGVLAILSHCPVGIDSLRQAFDVFTSRVPRIDAPRFSHVEYLLGCNGIQRMFTDDGNGQGRLIPGELYEWKKHRMSLYAVPISRVEAVRICLTHPGRLETTALFDAYSRFVQDLARRTPWELHKEGTDYDQKLRDLFAGNYYLRDCLISVGRCIQIGRRDRASGEAFVTVLAIFLYKAQEGRWPESLMQLVDARLLQDVPMDPYSGEALIYRVTENGFTLYSVGEDFVDNDGQSLDWENGLGADHVFWPIPKPMDIMDEFRSMYEHQSGEDDANATGEDN